MNLKAYIMFLMKRKDHKDRKLLPPTTLGWQNLALFLAGLVVLVIGYILLSVAPWDNPISRSLAPVVLLLGYLVIFPVAIFYRAKRSDKSAKDKRQPS